MGFFTWLSEAFKFGIISNAISGHSYSSAANVALILLGCLAAAAIGYFLGSINFAVIISRRHNDDIRRHGSGNAGMTNMLRTYGKGAGALTFAGDFLKGVAAVLIARFTVSFPTLDGVVVFGQYSSAAIPEGTVYGIFPLGAYIAALFAVIGHTFPVYYRFRGGKGVAVTAGAILALSFPPYVFLAVMFVFALVLLATKMVSLASLIAAMVYPIFLNRIEGPGLSNIFALLIAAIVVFNHRENIKRMLRQEEPKISFGKKNKDGNNK